MRYALVISYDRKIHRVELFSSENNVRRESVIWEIMGYKTQILYAETTDGREFTTTNRKRFEGGISNDGRNDYNY